MADGLVRLQAADMDENDSIPVTLAIANQSVTIANMLKDIPDSDEPIPLINVTRAILEKVIEYCERHQDDPAPAEEERNTEEISPWDKDFCNVDQATLFELILAANFLDIKPLLDLTCKTVANMIKGKTPEEIRKTFNIKNDFTPEEEEKIRRENEWCEER
eukprot:TRINITY_DN10_c0_g1_i1.p1 TRINITY_DN10_c0_g1~~TRINITY_DN10_c0_g1_i1.p1  ORF type:complete len:161 (-),score=47.32 TRINITY_DN10_c0_g1_i1:31-513(-)